MQLFTIQGKQGKARIGELQTKNGKITTPFFMPVATKATAKHLSSEDLSSMQAPATISNAFLLSLKPGTTVIKQHGGLGKFMHYQGITFTDSGGFQMYSKKFLKKATTEGIHFKNPYNGTPLLMTPEKNMQIQTTINSDVAMCLDHMPLIENSKEDIQQAVEQTTHWAERCKKIHDNLWKKQKKKQLLFGITQGGIHKDLRRQSAQALKSLNLDGYAIGGLALGEPEHQEYAMIELQKKIIPKEKVCYLMGAGNPIELLEAINRGVDCFDSRFPTQNARRGTIFTSQGRLRLLSKPYEHDKQPLDNNCTCFVCTTYSRAYIRYQLLQQEGTGYRLASYHNLYYLHHLMRQAQEAITHKTFKQFLQKTKRVYKK